MRMEATREALEELRRAANATRPPTADPMYDSALAKADNALTEVAKIELILAQVEKLIVIEGLLEEIKDARKA